jgi:hypothetical protein
MDLPTRRQVDALFEDYAVPKPIWRHCQAVAQVGRFLACELVRAGVAVDVDLVERSCLVHDLFKVATLEELDARPEWGYWPSHAETQAWRRLREQHSGKHETEILGVVLVDRFPEFAGFVSRLGSLEHPTYLFESLETKLVHYADWRVQHDIVVTLAERLEYLRRVYAREGQRVGTRTWTQVELSEFALEAALFAALDFTPAELSAKVSA